MITDFYKSQTKVNLMKAFAGQSQPRERYKIAASFAKKEGLQVIEQAFLIIAEQEKEHGELFYKFLKELFAFFPSFLIFPSVVDLYCMYIQF